MNRCAEEYMDAVCAQIQYREVHEEIRGELQSHIEEAADVYIQEKGCSVEEAVRRAIADMGDPVEAGRRFNSIHRPRMDWHMISLTVILMMIGLFVMYSLEVAESDWMPALVWGKFVSIVLGLIVLFGLLFFDYRSIARYGMGIFAATTA